MKLKNPELFLFLRNVSSYALQMLKLSQIWYTKEPE